MRSRRPRWSSQQVSSSFHESSTATDDQRVELVTLRAQTEALKGQIESYEQEIQGPARAPRGQDRRGRGVEPATRGRAGEKRPARHPPGRARPPDHRANHRLGGARTALPGADRPLRPAEPYPCGAGARLRSARCRSRDHPQDRGRGPRTRSPTRRTAIASPPRPCAPRRRWSRRSCGRCARSAPGCSARSPR